MVDGIWFRNSGMSSKAPSSLAPFDSVGDRIRQHRQADKRSVLVVEGGSDQRLIDRLTGERWVIFPAGSRGRVAPAVFRAQELGVKRIAGLIDRDFDNYFENLNAESVFSWAEADLEAVLIRGPWFENLLQEMGSDDKIDAAGGAATLRPIAIGIAGVVGKTRRANAQYGWGIDFKTFEWIKKVDAASLTMALAKFGAAIEALVDGKDEKAQLRELLRSADSTNDGGIGSFRGKDALEVMKLALKRKYGNTSSTDAHILAAALRLHVGEKLLQEEPFPAIIECLAAQ